MPHTLCSPARADSKHLLLPSHHMCEEEAPTGSCPASRPRVAAPPRPCPGPLHPHSVLWKLVEMINPGEGRQVLGQAHWRSTLAEVDPDTGELEGLLGLPGVIEEIRGFGFKSFNCWGWGGGSNGCPYRGQVQLLAPTLCGSQVSSRQYHGIQCPSNCFLSPQVASMYLSRSSK